MAKLKTVAQLEQCADKIAQYGVVDKIDGASVPVLLVKIANDMQQQFNTLQKMLDVNFKQFNKILDLEKTIEKNNREIVGLIEKLDSQENEIKKPITYEQSIVQSLALLGISCDATMREHTIFVTVTDDYAFFILDFNTLIKERFEIVNSITSMIIEAREGLDETEGLEIIEK